MCLQLLNENVFVKFIQYAAFNALLAWSCCFVMWIISPAASGSGIPDVKAYLNGVESPIFKNFFTIKTFVAKVVRGMASRARPERRPALLGPAPTGCRCARPPHTAQRLDDACPRQVISSALAVSSSLVMGKEGPMLHAGSILAVIMGQK